VERRWRTRAILEELVTPRLGLILTGGAALLVLAVIVDAAALQTALGLAGLALVVIFVVFPFLTAATIGSTTFDLRLAFAQRRRTTQELYGAYRRLLARVATELGCRREVDAWVEDALGRAHADSGLVPHGARLRHVLCQLTDVIRGETWRAAPAPDPDWADLAVLPFDQRAAVVLRRTAQLPVDDCAAVLHVTPEELDSLLAAADRALRDRPAPGTDR
jgi:hypothetical protein